MPEDTQSPGSDPSASISDAQCAEILESVEDYLESREPDACPNSEWAGGDWRIGRSGTHSSRIYDMAAKALPGWVGDGAARHFDRQEES